MPHFPKPFYKQKRQTWYVQVDGKQINLGTDRETAFQAYHKLMSEDKQTRDIESSDACVMILDRYLGWVHKHRAGSTYENYRRRIQSFVTHLKIQGQLTLTVDELTPMHIQEWVDSHSNWSDGMKRGMMIVVQGALIWAARMGLLKSVGNLSPIAKLEKPSAGKRDRVISLNEYDLILESVLMPEFRDLIELAWLTGARPQELVRLEVRHVDPTHECWTFAPLEAKGKRWRSVYLNTEALAITNRLVDQRKDGHLLVNSDGKPWTRYAVACAFQRLAKRIGTQYCLYHFRHTWATRALTQGIDPITVSVLMGHADGSMLGMVYQHLNQDRSHLRESVKKTLT